MDAFNSVNMAGVSRQYVYTQFVGLNVLKPHRLVNIKKTVTSGGEGIELLLESKKAYIRTYVPTPQWKGMSEQDIRGLQKQVDVGSPPFVVPLQLKTQRHALFLDHSKEVRKLFASWGDIRKSHVPADLRSCLSPSLSFGDDDDDSDSESSSDSSSDSDSDCDSEDSDDSPPRKKKKKTKKMRSVGCQTSRARTGVPCSSCPSKRTSRNRKATERAKRAARRSRN